MDVVDKKCKELYICSFKEIWYVIFLWCLAVTVIAYGLASLLALRSLRKHKLGRYLPVMLAINGLVYPLTGGAITSAFIAWIYTEANVEMEKMAAFLWGSGQTILLLIISFVRIYGTL